MKRLIPNTLASALLACLGLYLTQADAQTKDPPVKKSPAGYCYSKGDKHYPRLSQFTPYPSLRACLDSGGRIRRVVDH